MVHRYPLGSYTSQEGSLRTMKVGSVRRKRGSEFSTLVSLATIALVISALYFGKEVFMPFALALLLSFLLTPPVTWLEKLKLGRAPSVVVVLTLALATASGILWLATTQFTEVVAHLPQYRRNLQKKIEAMRNPAGYGLLKAVETLQQLSGELTESDAAVEIRNNPPATGAAGKPRSHPSPTGGPLAVELVKHPPGLLESFGSIGTPLMHFLGTVGTVLIFTLFLLLQRSDLRNRLFRLFGSETLDLNRMTTALDDAAQRV